MTRPLPLILAALTLWPAAAAASPRLALPDLAALWPQADVVPVQECEGECPEEPEEPYYQREEGAPPANLGRTELIVTSIEGITQHCSFYNKVWRIDCLRDGLNHVAQSLPVGADYDQMRADIARSVKELEAVVETYADPAQPAVRRSAVVEDRRRTTGTPIRPVAAARLPEATAAAEAVVTELSTTLLRSAATNATAAVHLEAAAAAVDDTLILLRSS